MTGQKRASMAQNQYGERVIRIDFPYDLDTLSQVRTLTGRLYHKEERCWSAPIYEQTLESLINWGFILDEQLTGFLNKVKKRHTEVVAGKLVNLKGELYPFQKEGIAWMETHNGRALIGDEMGLGKTIQAIGWLTLHPDLRPAIIVCPASLKLNWKREISKWTNETSVEILSGTIISWIPESDIVIINYDIVNDWLNKLGMINPQVLILDEIHYIKSNSAQRTKAVKFLAKGIPHVIGLSGTPIINRPIEAYNAIKIIKPDLFPDRWQYAKAFCKLKRTQYGWDLSGHSNEDILHQKLTSTIMIRRLKKDVLSELPDKVHTHIPMELSNQNEYNKAEADFIEFIRQTKGNEAARRAANAEAFTRIETLKQLSATGKMQDVVEWIKDFLEVDGKLVVFATHHSVINTLMSIFSKIAVKIDGTVSMEQRQRAVDRFQEDPKVRLFIGNIKAAGVGITLTAASSVAFVELPWTPGELDQASDRCHRIGQKDTVNVYYLLAKDTIEDHLAEIIDTKRKVTDAVLNGQESEETSLLYELMKSYE